MISFGRYERKDLLDQYIRTQWGPTLPEPYLKSEPFYQAILNEARQYIENASVLDVGCALGRLSFEYEKLGARKSVGIDTSRQFVHFCNQHKNPGEKVQFIRGDVMRAKFEKNSFQFISCINVIDRVQNPQKLVDRLHALLAGGGVLLLVDPYDWEFSPTPQSLRTHDMKELLDTEKWETLKESRDLLYTIPIAREERTYTCHLLVVKKLS